MTCSNKTFWLEEIKFENMHRTKMVIWWSLQKVKSVERSISCKCLNWCFPLSIAWLSLNFKLQTSWVSFLFSVSEWVKHLLHLTKSQLFSTYAGIKPYRAYADPVPPNNKQYQLTLIQYTWGIFFVLFGWKAWLAKMKNTNLTIKVLNMANLLKNENCR